MTKTPISPTQSHLTPSLGLNTFEFLDELRRSPAAVRRRRFLGPIACVILTQGQRVTDISTIAMLVEGSAKQAMLTPCKNGTNRLVQALKWGSAQR